MQRREDEGEEFDDEAFGPDIRGEAERDGVEGVGQIATVIATSLA